MVKCCAIKQTVCIKKMVVHQQQYKCFHNVNINTLQHYSLLSLHQVHSMKEVHFDFMQAKEDIQILQRRNYNCNLQASCKYVSLSNVFMLLLKITLQSYKMNQSAIVSFPVLGWTLEPACQTVAGNFHGGQVPFFPDHCYIS